MIDPPMTSLGTFVADDDGELAPAFFRDLLGRLTGLSASKPTLCVSALGGYHHGKKLTKHRT
jgi:hypothetical protein